jgi:hypothetical protein
MVSGTVTLLNNQSSAIDTTIPVLVTMCGFKLLINMAIVVSGTTYYTFYDINGSQSSTGLVISVISNIGDTSGVTFSASGTSLYYTSTNISGFTSNTVYYNINYLGP